MKKIQWIIVLVAIMIIVLFSGRSLTTTPFGESAPKFVRLEPGNIGVPYERKMVWKTQSSFADSIIKGAPPLPKVGKIESSGKQVKVAVDSASPILKAELCYTCDVGPDVKQTWKTLPAAVDGKQVSAECRMASHFISSMFMTNQRSPENRNGRPVPSMFQTIAQRFNFKRLFA